MKKKTIVISLALPCLILTLPMLLTPAPGVTAANANRIQIGMTSAEIEKVFACKPKSEHGPTPNGPGSYASWDGSVHVAVFFSSDGKSCAALVYPSDGDPYLVGEGSSVFDRLRNWFLNWKP